MVTISDNASSMGGSQILLETGESMSVDDLLKGITVASGNDAVVALAEKIGGTEENFVKMMNDKAKELGLKNTNFKNCHGLDDKDHYSSARDMSIIAKELVKHQKILDYSSIYETYLRKGTKKEIWLVNTNKLVRFKQGVDGLKTGYTENSGYCLTATMKQGDMRVIAVAMGEPDSSTRNNEISGMLDYAFAQYSIDTIYKKDDIVDNIKLDKSNVDSVDIVPLEDIKILYKKVDGKKDIKYEIKYNKIPSKINIGDVIGYMIIKDGDKEIKKVNVTVNRNVNKSSYLDLLSKNIRNIVTGNINI
jgi:D-alanyl-D-alanine carboxypeptidase (penicillin-binding protein 5/6)